MAWLTRAGEVLSCPRGNVAVTFALTLPLVVGAAGFGIETSYWYTKQLQLQAAADAGAYAAAIEKRSGSDDSVVIQTATNTAQQNGYDNAAGTLQVNSLPGNAQAVQLVLQAPAQRFFTVMFSSAPVTLHARATAAYNSSASACILALNKASSKAALFSGSSQLSLQGCSVMANSVAGDAVTLQGSAQLSVDCLISGGGVSTTSGLNLTSCQTPTTQAPPAADPYKALAVPTDSGGCRNDNGATLQPGNYCNGMSLSGSVNLRPGIYIVSGGDLKVNANAAVIGSGVTIYLKGTGRVSINGNATVQLSAPTSGTYSGILMFGDRTNSSGRNIFNGTAGSQLTGALYFPTQEVDYLGNFSGAQGCMQIVADTVQWSGNTGMSVDCASAGLNPIPAMSIVKLTA